MVFLGLLATSAQAQDSELVRYIDSIKAIDNHSHITALDRDHDKGYDQLRCDVLPPTVGLPAANFRFNPDQQWAYKTLYGFDAKTGSEAEIKSRSRNCIREPHFDAARNESATNSLGSV
jgi:hypothetical protein